MSDRFSLASQVLWKSSFDHCKTGIYRGDAHFLPPHFHICSFIKRCTHALLWPARSLESSRLLVRLFVLFFTLSFVTSFSWPITGLFFPCLKLNIGRTWRICHCSMSMFFSKILFQVPQAAYGRTEQHRTTSVYQSVPYSLMCSRPRGCGKLTTSNPCFLLVCLERSASICCTSIFILWPFFFASLWTGKGKEGSACTVYGEMLTELQPCVSKPILIQYSRKYGAVLSTSNVRNLFTRFTCLGMAVV